MKKRMILASSSPRRQALFKLITEDFDVLAMDVDESTTQTDPVVVVELLAQKKAGAAADAVQNPSVILGADTIVVQDGQILGKPTDAEDAARMLQKLSGKAHMVYTGYCLIDTETGRRYTAHAKTEVVFYPMTDSE
ncbi:MAG: Maf family protein, partial [Eubacteriales bacterium]